MRSLRLSKETLTALTEEQLGAVVGGDSIEVRSEVRTFCWSCVGMCIKP